MPAAPVETRARLLTDRGSGYLASAFEDYLRALQIRHIYCAPYHPQTNGKLDLQRQISLVRSLAATAPASIHADAQRFLQALEQVGTDPKVRDNATVKRAVDNVNRYASNRCALFNQQPNGI